MSTPISRRGFLTGIGALSSLGILSACTSTNVNTAPTIQGLPEQTVWSTHPVGTGSYNDVAAIANAFTNDYGLQVRLLSAGTGIGRIGPIITGTAQLGRSSVEYYYAFEAEDEYCNETWGPQPMRLLWPAGGNYGILVRTDSGIETVEDLAGKRVPNVTGNPAVNRNIEALLAYGGLTYDDVNLIGIAYSEQAEAMKTGHLDVMFENPTGTAVQELASEYPVTWLDFGEEDEWRFEKWPEIVPMATTSRYSGGAGMDDDEVITNMEYSIPFVSIEDADENMIYAFVKLLHESYDSYSNTTLNTPEFHVDELLLDPLVTPFHPGAIRYLEEINIWTPDLQRRQDALLARETAMVNAWPQFWEANGNADDVNERWKTWKRDNLAPLPDVNDLA